MAFGSSPETHRRKSFIDARDTRAAIQSVERALKRGDCTRAVESLYTAGYWYGQARAHAMSVGGTKGKHRNTDRYTGAAPRLLKFKRRVINACVVKYHKPFN